MKLRNVLFLKKKPAPSEKYKNKRYINVVCRKLKLVYARFSYRNKQATIFASLHTESEHFLKFNFLKNVTCSDMQFEYIINH